MPQKLSPISKPSELVASVQEKNLVIVDARAGAGAKERYAAGHLEGALFVDLEKQLANVPADASKGGRHPLPDLTQFAQVLTQLGIGPDTHVVVYDDKNGGNAAARFWWMLKAIGHENIQVLDGGLDAAVKAGFPVSSGEETPTTPEKTYETLQWMLPLSDINEVEKVANDADYLVIDVRDKDRFDGKVEPIDLIAGHIPGAANIPFTSNLDANGFFLSPAELKEKYTEALNGRDAQHVIVHCGSGVTACHTLLAMAYAEMEIPKLYVGSWSEWSRTDRPMFTLSKD
ncbi:sulfurtransferase [Runella salmonicolor]|uniref:Sulfurtransferase n=1 Tax=Runella salmonicolor TaxID=2950278 RepID=A0ABT1FRV4_9BACT|nr:sulfurtransferase [Runella salmonicolor]MCP1384492.1 sulfurtransferase [Runella salmonicolor]